MQLRIRTYSPRVSAVREINAALKGLRILEVGSRYAPSVDHLVVNWGVGDRNAFRGFPNVLNSPGAVANAINKISALRIMKEAGVPVPEFTSVKEEVEKWRAPYISRTTVTSFGGRGATWIDPKQTRQVPNALLYTRYVPKKTEYRVHVFKGKVLDVQEKRKRTGAPKVDPKIRSYDNGWVYCRQGINPPPAVSQAALAAVAALGLDFGAADIGWNEKNRAPTVYEVNTAPGIEGTTLKNYIKAIGALLKDKKPKPVAKKVTKKKVAKKKVKTIKKRTTRGNRRNRKNTGRA